MVEPRFLALVLASSLSFNWFCCTAAFSLSLSLSLSHLLFIADHFIYLLPYYWHYFATYYLLPLYPIHYSTYLFGCFCCYWCFSHADASRSFAFLHFLPSPSFPLHHPSPNNFFILNNYWLYPYYIKSYRLILRHILTTHFLFCLFHFISFARSDLVFAASFVAFHFSLSPLFPMITNSSCCVFAWFSLVPLVCLQLPAPPLPPQLIRPTQPRPVIFTLPLFSFQLISAFQRQSRQFRHSISVSLPLLFN